MSHQRGSQSSKVSGTLGSLGCDKINTGGGRGGWVCCATGVAGPLGIGHAILGR